MHCSPLSRPSAVLLAPNLNSFLAATTANVSQIGRGASLNASRKGSLTDEVKSDLLNDSEFPAVSQQQRLELLSYADVLAREKFKPADAAPFAGVCARGKSNSYSQAEDFLLRVVLAKTSNSFHHTAEIFSRTGRNKENIKKRLQISMPLVAFCFLFRFLHLS